MQATRSTLRRWIDRGLEAAGYPPLDEIVTAARAEDPPVSWARIATDVSNKCGEHVTYECLRRWFGMADTAD